MGAAGAAMGAAGAGGVAASGAQYSEGKMTAAYYDYLAETSRRSAKLARTAGEANARSMGDQAFDEMRGVVEGGRKLLGTQVAAISGGGAGASSRTGQQIVKQTLDRASLDEMALNFNTARKRKAILDSSEFDALNEEQQAEGYGLAGKNAMTSARIGHISSLLGTAGSVSSQWANWQSSRRG